MKRLCAGAAILGLGVFSPILARAAATDSVEVRNVAPAFSGAGISLLAPASSIPDASLGFSGFGSSHANTPFAVPAAALPAASSAAPAAPAPDPRFLFGSVDDYRWQAVIGYEFVRFRSDVFDASLNGVNAGVAYFTNNWFAVEGNWVAAFGGGVFGGETAKYLLFTGGPKIVWREHKLEPWAHALFGGLHMYPQTAYSGLTSFAFQIGGGVDWRFTPVAALRLSGDWVRSELYSGSQNNFQIGVSFVYNF